MFHLPSLYRRSRLFKYINLIHKVSVVLRIKHDGLSETIGVGRYHIQGSISLNLDEVERMCNGYNYSGVGLYLTDALGINFILSNMTSSYI